MARHAVRMQRGANERVPQTYRQWPLRRCVFALPTLPDATNGIWCCLCGNGNAKRKPLPWLSSSHGSVNEIIGLPLTPLRKADPSYTASTPRGVRRPSTRSSCRTFRTGSPARCSCVWLRQDRPFPATTPTRPSTADSDALRCRTCVCVCKVLCLGHAASWCVLMIVSSRCSRFG